MAEILFTTNFSPVTDEVILVWYLNSNPVAEVDRVTLSHPNIDGEDTVVTGLTSALYKFAFYESSDGTTLDNLVTSPIYARPKSGLNAVELYHYTVDGPETYDPASGQDTLNDSRLEGKTFHVSQRVNDWRQPIDYVSVAGGGFQLLTGEEFVEGDQWTVMVIGEALVSEVPVFSTQEINIVTETEDFGVAHMGKHNIADHSTGTTIVLTFNAFSLIPDNTSRFTTHSTAGRYWRLQFATGDTVKWLGEDANAIVLRRNEEVELIFEGGVCYAIYKGGAELAGEFVLADKKLINTEYADGTEHDIADFQDTIDRLPAAKKVSYTDWDLTSVITVGEITFTRYKNRGKFAVDNVAGTFKFPDGRDFHFRSLKNNDGTSDADMLTQGTGGMWAQELISHRHEVSTTGNQATINPGRTLQRGGTPPVPGDTGYGDGGGYIIETGGNRQMVDSIGQHALVRL